MCFSCLSPCFLTYRWIFALSGLLCHCGDFKKGSSSVKDLIQKIQLKWEKDTTTHQCSHPSPQQTLQTIHQKECLCQKKHEGITMHKIAVSERQEGGETKIFFLLIRPLLPDPTVSTNGISRFKSIPSLLSWLVNGEITWLKGKSSFKACAVIIKKITY